MRLKLATKISIVIIGIEILSALGSVGTLLLARHFKALLAITISEAVPSVLAEAELGSLLQRQRGVVAAYVLDDGNPRWLERLHGFESQFKEQIALIRETTHVSADEAEILGRLEKICAELVVRRDEAIALYQGSKGDQAKCLLLEQVNTQLFSNAHECCQELIAANNRDLEELNAETSTRIQQANWIVGVSLTLTVGLGLVLMAMFFYGVLLPLRGMVADARLLRSGAPESDAAAGAEELHAVRSHLRNLMTDVADTRTRMLNAEKLALVGRLAAGVAHEIRNPLTAMKMWLFSARETAQGDAELDRKLGIVSDEMLRLDRIIRNFLEFSRPRGLDRQSQDMAAIINQTLELLAPRLRQTAVQVIRAAPSGLPRVRADGEQLKQVLLNLILNAVEAMKTPGQIQIASSVENDADGRPMVVVRVHDNGPGIPAEVRNRIFEPFFTTKDGGTGLGLCIGAQIMAHHDGSLEMERSSEQGTVFAMWTPIAPGDGHGPDSSR